MKDGYIKRLLIKEGLYHFEWFTRDRFDSSYYNKDVIIMTRYGVLEAFDEYIDIYGINFCFII